MQPTNDDLQAAFNRSKLPRLGYSFQAAMACEMLKKCLVRLAINAHSKTYKTPVAAPLKRAFWWTNY